MAQTFALTEGSIERIYNASGPDDEIFSSSPTVQIVSFKKVAPREGQVNALDRYRLIVSDGKFFAQAMLATQLSHLVDENQLHRGSVVKLDKVTCNRVQGKKLVILLQVNILSTGVLEKMGNPIAVDAPADGSTAASPASAATTPVPQPQQPPPRAQPQQAQQTARQPAAGSSRTTTSPRAICPIESLSPYQNKWEIRARVLFKSDLRHWVNQKGQGKVFNVTLGDETGEINATGFNDAADAFYEKLQKDKVYYVSKARINIAKNKKFSNVANEYEIMLDERNTIIEECTDAAQMPAVRYNFVPLNELENKNKDDICDVIAIVKDASDIAELTSKAGKQFIKRELTLVDQSGYSVRLTLFGKQAEEYAADSHPVAAFRGVKVGDFGGRSLSMLNSSSMDINPDIPEAFSLKGWFDNDGQTQAFHSYSNGAMMSGSGGKFDRSQVSTIADIRDSKLGEPGGPDTFSCRATIVHIKTENLAYPACQTEGCSKKVTETSEGWTCEKCGKSWDRPQYRYMVSMSVADHTGQAWLSGFNDVGLVVFGQTADEMMALKEADEGAYLNALQKAACNAYNFSCRAKIDSYNEITRTRFSITKILPLDYKEEAMALRDLLYSDWAK